jgi:hypothetical protein
LFFKKLNNKSKLPSHNPTGNSTKLVNSMATLFEESNSIIWIGYCVDKSWTNLLEICAVSIEGKNINWISDLTEYSSKSAEIIPIDNNVLNGDREQKQLVTIKVKPAKAE